MTARTPKHHGGYDTHDANLWANGGRVRTETDYLWEVCALGRVNLVGDRFHGEINDRFVELEGPLVALHEGEGVLHAGADGGEPRA